MDFLGSRWAYLFVGWWRLLLSLTCSPFSISPPIYVYPNLSPSPSMIIIINEFWVLIFWCAHSSMKIMSTLFADSAQQHAHTLLFMCTYQSYPIHIWEQKRCRCRGIRCMCFRSFFLRALMLSQQTFSLIEKKNRNLITDMCNVYSLSLSYYHKHSHP